MNLINIKKRSFIYLLETKGRRTRVEKGRKGAEEEEQPTFSTFCSQVRNNGRVPRFVKIVHSALL